MFGSSTALALLAASPQFVERAAAAGVVYQHYDRATLPRCPFGPGRCEAERLAGGATAGDANGDGWTDLYVTRVDAGGLLFVNRGDGTFADGTAAAGLGGSNSAGNGAAFADIDNDGDADLYVATLGAPHFLLWMNDGSGSFTEESGARGVGLTDGDVIMGTSVAFGDYDRDGWLDIYTTEWKSTGPDSTSHARLLRNLGAGFFTDVTDAAGVSYLDVHPWGIWAFAPAFVDLDGDGWPDLAVAADFGSSRLFWNDGDGTFSDGTVAAGVGTDENGMGSAFGDHDGDGRLDWFVTSILDPYSTCERELCSWGDSGNRLYRYAGARRFEEITDAAGVRDGGWGWGAAFLDYDQDGDVDLTMTNGVLYTVSTLEDPFNDDPMRLWENGGGERALEAGLSGTAQGKALLTLDYDRDGDLDLFVTNNGGAPELYRNDVNGGASLRVRVRGTVSNADARGARVIVVREIGERPLVRVIGVGSHFLGESEQDAHFGLGEASSAAGVCVVYPGGGVEWMFEASGAVLFIEPADAPLAAPPPADCDGDAVPDAFAVALVPAFDCDADGALDGCEAEPPPCSDACPADPHKVEAGICGCGITDRDRDGDALPDCVDGCPEDGAKVEPGLCGCGATEIACREQAARGGGGCGAVHGAGLFVLLLLWRRACGPLLAAHPLHRARPQEPSRPPPRGARRPKTWSRPPPSRSSPSSTRTSGAAAPPSPRG